MGAYIPFENLRKTLFLYISKTGHAYKAVFHRFLANQIKEAMTYYSVSQTLLTRIHSEKQNLTSI